MSRYDDAVLVISDCGGVIIINWYRLARFELVWHCMFVCRSERETIPNDIHFRVDIRVSTWMQELRRTQGCCHLSDTHVSRGFETSMSKMLVSRTQGILLPDRE